MNAIKLGRAIAVLHAEPDPRGGGLQDGDSERLLWLRAWPVEVPLNG